MAEAYVKSGSGVAEFVQSRAYTLGERMVPKRSDTAGNHLVGKRYVWECTTAGTTAAAEPTWAASVTINTTTLTSGTAVFTARRPGFNSSNTADWTFASPFMDYPGALMVAGDTVYVSNNHAESVATAWGVTNGTAMQPGVRYLCVDDSSTPPTTLATTATVTTTGARNLLLATGGGVPPYAYGITFICGSGDNGSRLLYGQAAHLERCSLQIASTGGSSTIGLNGSETGAYLKDCTFKFGNAAQWVSGGGINFVIDGGSIASGGTSPTSFVIASAVTIKNFDFSNANSAMNIANTSVQGDAVVRVHNCKMPTSWSGALDAVVSARPFALSEMMSVDTAGTNYVYRRKSSGGDAFSETTIVRSGGASDGTTAISHKLVSNSSALFPMVMIGTPVIAVWNDTAGSSRTATIEVITDNVTLTDGDLWMVLDYYSETGSPLGAQISSAKANVLASASNLASSSATWTTTGLSTPVRQKVSVTFTPRLKGFVQARVLLARPSTTVYVDPKITLS